MFIYIILYLHTHIKLPLVEDILQKYIHYPDKTHLFREAIYLYFDETDDAKLI